MKRRYSKQEYNNAFIIGVVVGMLLMILANMIRWVGNPLTYTFAYNSFKEKEMIRYEFIRC